MVIKERKIKGVFEIQLQSHKDTRGFFMRVYDEKIFSEYKINRKWVQENHSFSARKGTIRGIHIQYPYPEEKLIRVLNGKVYFVIVDLRKKSPTLGYWDDMILSGSNNKMIFVPRGCAPGMCTLTDNCSLYYKIDTYYEPDNENSIQWNDSDLKIQWPVKKPTVISERDNNGQSFKKFIETLGGGIEI